ncbi:MAG: T9SS type A sorting domain-containing protein, partial [Saprospiraceae bacterium]|nr:T9SS type A sorting domain-containing protein [Saprospiraceae bacterium]MCB0681073.1 T9SS type A sorting domain-containing protein [Saprospiraceae bacterium]
PATERLTLQILDPSGPEWELEIVNVFGQPLYRRQVPVGAQALPLNIESLPAGVYFLTLRSVKGQHWHFEVLKVE